MSKTQKNIKKEGTAITTDYIKQLTEEKKTIEKLTSEIERRLKTIKTQDNRNIGYSKRKNGYQYYLMESDGRRIYIKEKDLDMVRRKFQKDYYLSVYDILKSMYARLTLFLRKYDFDAISATYENLCDARKCFVKPLTVSVENFIDQWYKEHPGSRNPFYETGQYLTDKGEYVRSKSEKILADLFCKYRIPYSYEPQFELTNGSMLYPDFVLLNVRKRKTLYWEHFGLISDPEYAKKTLWKLSMYEQNGLRIGEDLLFSTESEETTLSVRNIEKKIKEYLL